MKIFYYPIVCCVMLVGSLNEVAADETIAFKVDTSDALILAEEVSHGLENGDSLKNVESDPSDPFLRVNEQAYDFIDIWDVNPWTGDVWNVWSCKKFSSKKARKIQLEIRKRFTPEEMKQYKRLAALKPSC